MRYLSPLSYDLPLLPCPGEAELATKTNEAEGAAWAEP